MKKFWHSRKHKQYRRRKAWRSLKAQLATKAFQRLKRQRGQRRKKRKNPRGEVRYNFVTAPRHLSFVGNPEEVGAFIAALKRLFDQHKPVFVDLREVEQIDYDGIVVLLSKMIQFKANELPFNGNFPRALRARAILQESGFFTHLRREREKYSNTYTIHSKSSLLTHANKVADSELSTMVVSAATETVWGEERRCPGVQRTLIELMQNTVNHASLEREGEKHWWLSVKHVHEQSMVAFSFVDYGVGIFENLREKAPGSVGYGWLDYIYGLLGFASEPQALLMMLNGEDRKTASGAPFRGKGLPAIWSNLQKNKITNLAIITNNVYYNSQSNTCTQLSVPFQGTFVYWELHASNRSIK